MALQLFSESYKNGKYMYSLNRIITDNESMYIKWKNSLISACISTLYVHMYRYIAILVFGIFRNS